MGKRPFRYQEYLDKHSNCPPSDCVEKDKTCYRWVHTPISEKDFIPLQLHPTIPPRILDTSDKQCMGYGLSLFKTLSQAREIYLREYNKRQRLPQKEAFKKEKGEKIAEIKIKEQDGVISKSNNYGHFTFYEYVGCDFSKNINGEFDIFVVDGTN